MEIFFSTSDFNTIFYSWPKKKRKKKKKKKEKKKKEEERRKRRRKLENPSFARAGERESV